jgi:hypothetical protein
VAVVLWALERLQQVGAGLAIVYTGGRDRDAPARKLYERVGFRRHTRAVELRKAR